MKLYSAHLKADAEPLLLQEGFSWGCLIFGPFWLAAQRAWIAAAIVFVAYGLIFILAPARLVLLFGGALAVLLGLTGFDLCRWSADQRGYLLVHLVAARDSDEAWQRLLTHRPDLAGQFARDALR